ncbi:alpha-galactosidase [Bacteroides sp. f07]|uniref:alpha-galactosidase n=1 Tax=Bacteroides sp. f07 TaxID=3132704 RepID=UPI0036F2CCC3
MKNINIFLTYFILSILLLSFASCQKEYEMRPPSTAPYTKLPDDLPDVGNIHTYKAPLYWSTYGFNRAGSRAGKASNDCLPTKEEYSQILDWLQENFVPYGYDLICTDGWGNFNNIDENHPYTTSRGSGKTEVEIKWLVDEANKRGIKTGIYDSPLWYNCDPEKLIPGTSYTVGSLAFDPEKDYSEHKPDHEVNSYNWIIYNHPGALEYIEGFFKHYNDLGVKMIRIDFLLCYEDGWSRIDYDWNGYGYGRVNYARALGKVAQEAKKHGIFTSLVMPNLYNNAEVEGCYGNMARITGDAWDGTWTITSSNYRGQSWFNFPNCRNQFDGFTYWNHVMGGKDRIIPDGDPLMLHTYASDAECEFAVSLQLIAGGPVVIGDLPWDKGIENRIRFFQNKEMLALNADRFCAHPLDSKINSEGSNIWYGKMSDGTPIVAFFNRDDSARTRTLKLKDVGLDGEWYVRDLWQHRTETTKKNELSYTLGAHSCKIMKLSRTIPEENNSSDIDSSINDAVHEEWNY